MAHPGGGMNRPIIRKDHGNLLFSLTPPPISSIGRPCEVFGVAIVGKNVFVVYEDHEKIFKYDGDDLAHAVTDVIKVEGMGSPRDMVGDSKREELFVYAFKDRVGGVIWRVSITTKEIKEFARLNHPWGLSLVDRRLLVTSLDSEVTSQDSDLPQSRKACAQELGHNASGLNSMVILDSSSGQKIERITLRRDAAKREVAQHSVESERETLFVCFKEVVTEMSFDGKELRVFNNEHQRTCIHLALDSAGHRLFVADDCFNIIFVLNELLECQGIFIDNEQLDKERPCRLNYDEKNNRLAVGLRNGCVKIFEC